MKLLSIQTGHNATVALGEDGCIRGILSQEKCDNIKNSSDFPSQAIFALLKEVGWQISDINHVVIAGNFVYPSFSKLYKKDSKGRVVHQSPLVRFTKFLEHKTKMSFLLKPIKEIRRQNLAKQGEKDLLENLKKLGLSCSVSHVEHHLCHARSSYYTSHLPLDNKETLIFTLDGAGDLSCASVTRARGNSEWTLLGSTPLDASLGYIYSSVTKFLGMTPLEHEYKVMGLAPYAKEKYVRDLYERLLKPVITLDPDNIYTFKSSFNTSRFYDYLVKNAVGERFDNIAGAVQLLTEELVLSWIRETIRKTGVHRICTGGGVFMNVKLNKRIQEMEEVDEVFFMPSCGDESNPIGALYDHFHASDYNNVPLKDLYLGIHYNDDEIEKYLNENLNSEKYASEKIGNNIEHKVAELLAQGHVVARFSGRCEWGARSLGNRAILAHPSRMESFYMVNDYIKSRDFWMPFAPSILDNDAPLYLNEYTPTKMNADSMITAFSATEKGKHDLRAALHQGDHTLRPQVLKRETNPEYYNLISKFKELTGVGAILNTSLNLHGYPLVASPEQALFTLENSSLKYLAIGSYLVSKKK